MINQKYLRQINLIGEAGQEKLSAAKVAVIGVGALGSAAAELLVRSGVGSLVLIDRDVVELSNLQRQSLYSELDVGTSKVVAAKNRLFEINSSVLVDIHARHLTPKNISELVGKEIDLILDCTDNMNTRFLINDYAHKEKLAWIFASAVGWSGMLSLITTRSACLRCRMPVKAVGETCAEAGVIGPLIQIVAGMQSSIALRFLVGENLSGFCDKLFTFDLTKMSLREFIIKKNPLCKTCLGEYVALDEDIQEEVVRFCSSGMYQVARRNQINLNKLLLVVKKEFSDAVLDEVSLRFGPLIVFCDGRALIQSKTEEAAVAIYDRYIGC